MTRLVPTALIILTASAATADETRQLDAHEHGVGQLNIAFDGDQIAMELHAPGADIVGFEYTAESAEDRGLVDAAVATLARPLDLFALPAAAGCSVVQASASLESEEANDEHGHEDHAEHEEEGDDHAEHDHKDENHAAHEEDHDHAEEAHHTEFHAEYLLNCANPAQATLIDFAYFDAFPNALELEVQVITDRGATAFEVERDAPVLDLRDMF
ncbi:zinc uptake protein ZrgA [Roseobacter sp. EG26]|uniref:zinc uptake protein ZrgA n=1 Tax=Roseobacter sp. EG26 TaxID=3412477 RepID=UPI003CE4D7C7